MCFRFHVNTFYHILDPFALSHFILWRLKCIGVYGDFDCGNTFGPWVYGKAYGFRSKTSDKVCDPNCVHSLNMICVTSSAKKCFRSTNMAYERRLTRAYDLCRLLASTEKKTFHVPCGVLAINTTTTVWKQLGWHYLFPNKTPFRRWRHIFTWTIWRTRFAGSECPVVHRNNL